MSPDSVELSGQVLLAESPAPDRDAGLDRGGILRGLGIATFKLPERLELRDELPRNPLGKILKRELRDELRH